MHSHVGFEIEAVKLWVHVVGFDPIVEIEAVNYMFMLVGFGLVQIGSVALILDIESGAVKLWVHIGTTCIESHGVALESHLLLCDVFP